MTESAALTSWPSEALVRMERRWRGLNVAEGIVMGGFGSLVVTVKSRLSKLGCLSCLVCVLVWKTSGGGDIRDSPSEVRRKFLIWKAVLRLSISTGQCDFYTKWTGVLGYAAERAGLRLTQESERAEVSNGDLGGCLGKRVMVFAGNIGRRKQAVYVPK